MLDLWWRDFGHMEPRGARDGHGAVAFLPFLGPVIGPVAVGWIVENPRRRWVF